MYFRSVGLKLNWLVRPDWQTVPVSCGEWTVVNPLFDPDLGRYSSSPSIQLADGRIWIRAGSLIVGRLSDAPESPPIRNLLESLRYVTGQATIRPLDYPIGFGGLQLATSAHAPSPLFRGADIATWQRAMLETSVSSHHLALMKDVLPLPSVAESLLIDAASAYAETEWRRAVLFSALACESLTREKIDDLFDEAKKRRTSDSTLRFREVRTANGSDYIDSVLNLILKQDAIRVLVNEARLYLDGRSLVREDEPLFQAFDRLITTRNKIAHLGATAGGQKELTLDQTGAATALNTAIHIFAWWSVDMARFHLDHTFVEKDPNQRTERRIRTS